MGHHLEANKPERKNQCFLCIRAFNSSPKQLQQVLRQSTGASPQKEKRQEFVAFGASESLRQEAPFVAIVTSEVMLPEMMPAVS